MKTNLQCIVDKARAEKKLCFTSLAHHISPELLRQSLMAQERKTAVGVDEMDRDTALREFETWGPEVLKQIHRQGYRAPPVKRVWIPKPGKSEKRPIGIPTVIDRAVQRSTAIVLSQIYEQDFLQCSFGGRPQLSAHHAVCTLKEIIQGKKVDWVLECDLKNFFGSLDHGWIERFLKHRVADPRIVSLVNRWLKAGVLEEGELEPSEFGTPQGGSISVLISNIYLHYVLDLWFEKRVKGKCRGEVYLVRYLDDFVICCQYRSDAQQIHIDLEKRLGEFSLSLEPDKTKMLQFGRFAYRGEHLVRDKPATFCFLGFTFCCSRNSKGNYLVRMKTDGKRLRRFLSKFREATLKIRHDSIRNQVKALNAKLRGHFQYYGVGGNTDSLKKVERYCKLQWRKSLSSRSQRGNLTWEKFSRLLEYFPLAAPKLSLPYQLMPKMVRL